MQRLGPIPVRWPVIWCTWQIRWLDAYALCAREILRLASHCCIHRILCSLHWPLCLMTFWRRISFRLGGECWKGVVMKEILLILVSELLISKATRSYFGEFAPNTDENWLDGQQTSEEDSRTPQIESVELRSCWVDWSSTFDCVQLHWRLHYYWCKLSAFITAMHIAIAHII